jgi:serine/threonine protein kinase
VATAGQVDFGLSKSVSIHSDPSTVVGTVSYMAPEVLQLAQSQGGGGGGGGGAAGRPEADRYGG